MFCMQHLRGIIIFGMFMAIAYFLLHAADGAISDALHFSCSDDCLEVLY